MTHDTAYLAHDYARLYDWTYQGQRQDIEFYLSAARKYGSPLLEVACGTGRLTIPLAREGFEITGLDLSSEMLRIAQQKLDREPAAVRDRVELVQADMSDFDLGRQVNLAFIPVSSFFHLHTKEKQRTCLACALKHLAPGGALMVDLTPAAVMANQPVGELWVVGSSINPDTAKMTRELNTKLAIDLSSQRVTVEHTYEEDQPDGSQQRFVFVDSYTWSTEDQMRVLLRQAGFGKIDVFGSYDLQAYRADSPRMIFLAKTK